MGQATIGYPPHLYDPARRAIALRYVRHEMRKLLPSVRDTAIWEIADQDISRWFSENPTLALVRDFWNAIDGIAMGFKLKNLVSWFTSAHVQWEEKEVPTHVLWFGATLDEMKPIGEKPSAKEVRDWYFAPERAEVLEMTRREHEERSNQTMQRDEFPLIVIEKDDLPRVVDGNRRLLRSIIFEKETVGAVIAHPIAEPMIFEQWVPTSLLLHIVLSHRAAFEAGRSMTTATAFVIAELIRNSFAGRFEFVNRSLLLGEKADEQLLVAVKEKLKAFGIDL